jgi:hypothetical protein
MAVNDDLDIPAYNPATIVTSETVTIEAPASIVWEILTDMPRYGEWNPYCFSAKSTLEMGAPVHMKLNSYTTPGEVYPGCEYICAFVPERMISWELPYSDAMPYPARRDQIITALGSDRCTYYSTDAFFENGEHVMFFCSGWIKRAFDDTAKAIKARAEAMHAARKAAA